MTTGGKNLKRAKKIVSKIDGNLTDREMCAEVAHFFFACTTSIFLLNGIDRDPIIIK